MLWMCICMCPHHLTAAHDYQAFGILLPCYIYKRCLITFICCGCAYGCVPTTLRPLIPGTCSRRTGHWTCSCWSCVEVVVPDVGLVVVGVAVVRLDVGVAVVGVAIVGLDVGVAVMGLAVVGPDV